jgi:hypothetical protein
MPKRPRRWFLLLWSVIGLVFGSAPSLASATVRVDGGYSETEQNQGITPFSIKVAGDYYWSQLAWTTWTGVDASGSGTYFGYCIGEPQCPGAGGYLEYPVLVHLYFVKRCSGKRVFTRIRTTFTAGRPSWVDEPVRTDRLPCDKPLPTGGSGGDQPPKPKPVVACWTDLPSFGGEARPKVSPNACLLSPPGAESLAEAAAVRSLSWKHWGAQKAKGHGKICGAGCSPTTVTLTKLRISNRCGGRAYTKAKFKAKGIKPGSLRLAGC